MTNYLELLRWVNMRNCPYPKCKHKINDGVVQKEVKDGKITKWWPNGHFLFHYYDTHGFPAEMMVEELSKLINSEMTQEEVNKYNRIMKEINKNDQNYKDSPLPR